MATRADRMDRHPVQLAALVVGATFLLIGVLGFVPGITTNYGDLAFASEDSEAKLLGLFQVSILHNIVHLVFGIAGLAMMRTIDGARTFLIGGGVIYLALWLLGLVGGLDWLPVNTADDWLHFGLGVGMIGLGVLLGRDRTRVSTV